MWSDWFCFIGVGDAEECTIVVVSLDYPEDVVDVCSS